MWGLDVRITVACAVISAAMATLQLIAAWISLRAAWKIAADQRAETERAKLAGRAEFIAVVASLAESALIEADKAEQALRDGGHPPGILYNFRQRLLDLHESLQPIRVASPADAKLILAVGRLSRVLALDVYRGMDTQIAIQTVGQRRGSIGIELGTIRAFADANIAMNAEIAEASFSPTAQISEPLAPVEQPWWVRRPHP